MSDTKRGWKSALCAEGKHGACPYSWCPCKCHAEVAATALEQFGELYRDAEGHEVWRIRDRAGVVVQDGIASDYDAAFVAEKIS